MVRRWHQAGRIAIAFALTALMAGCAVGNAPAAQPTASAGMVSGTDYAQQLAQELHLSSPPTVSPVQSVEAATVDTAVGACMARVGFPPKADGSYEVTKQQSADFNRHLYICTLSYPAKPDPHAGQPLTTTQLERLYGFVLKTEIPCIEGLGFTISKVPSLSQFEADYPANTFYPFEQVWPQLKGDQISDAYINQLETACPQWPSDQVLYG